MDLPALLNCGSEPKILSQSTVVPVARGPEVNTFIYSCSVTQDLRGKTGANQEIVPGNSAGHANCSTRQVVPGSEKNQWAL
jgi:hypothetical protein